MRTIIITTFALLACALALSACGGDDAGTAPSAGSAGAKRGASLADGLQGIDGLDLEVVAGSGDAAPKLSWDSVEGASYYRVVVRNPKGEPEWSWEGNATDVVIGAGAPLSGGPGSTRGYTATATAWGKVHALAASRIVEIPA